jgi:hypothetical protein
VTATVIDLKSRDWREKPHRCGGLWCWTCEAKFVGVYPADRLVQSLECPRCDKQTLEEFASEIAYGCVWYAVWKPRGKATVRDSHEPFGLKLEKPR